jgi:hypothetical protein
MSVRNGDQSKFNRERKKKVLWKGPPALLERAAEAFKSGDTTVRAQPRPVWV